VSRAASRVRIARGTGLYVHAYVARRCIDEERHRLDALERELDGIAPPGIGRRMNATRIGKCTLCRARIEIGAPIVWCGPRLAICDDCLAYAEEVEDISDEETVA
jgi:hypothetical protein